MNIRTCDGQLVTLRDLYSSHEELARMVEENGPMAGLLDLMEFEPILGADIQQRCSAVAGQIAVTGAPAELVRLVFESAVTTAVGAVMATRQAYYEFWSDMMDTPVDQDEDPGDPYDDEMPF